jgi:hypothetical protein
MRSNQNWMSSEGAERRTYVMRERVVRVRKSRARKKRKKVWMLRAK